MQTVYSRARRKMRPRHLVILFALGGFVITAYLLRRVPARVPYPSEHLFSPAPDAHEVDGLSGIWREGDEKHTLPPAHGAQDALDEHTQPGNLKDGPANAKNPGPGAATADPSETRRRPVFELVEGQHPIPQLIRDAEERAEALVKKQSRTLPAAVAEYRRRYGIAPPPHFDRWFEFAKARNVVLLDEFDGVHRSLLPFWALRPATIRARAREALGGNNNLLGVMIRGGKVVNTMGGKEWLATAIKGMVANITTVLPNMDLCFNIHDEPRVVLPHDDLQRLLHRAEKEVLPRAAGVNTPRNSWSVPSAELGNGMHIPTTLATRFNVFAHQAVWAHSKMSCSPDSPSRDLEDEPPLDKNETHSITDLGFVYNHTAFADICQNPSFAEHYGFFTAPNTMNVASELFPIFSQSKIATYADILYPSPWYWADRVPYKAEEDVRWSKKSKDVYWRGSTTGGYSRNGGWRKQHRQHLVRTVNSPGQAMIYENTESPFDPPPKIEVPPPPTKKKSRKKGKSSQEAIVENLPEDVRLKNSYLMAATKSPGQASYGLNQDGDEEEIPIIEKQRTYHNQSDATASTKSGHDQALTRRALEAEPTPSVEAAELQEPEVPEQTDSTPSPKWKVKSVPRSLYAPLMNISFSHIGQCDPGDCAAQVAFFDLAPVAPPSDAYQHKLLLDMDGNAFSGRFYAFLRSASLVLKMNLFQEWHQDRLVPWLHYVPLSLRATEWLEVVRWFAWDPEGRKDAERLAAVKRDWAMRTLRNEDLEVWFFRLLLEYGRVVDDDRENIGFSLET